MANISKNYQIQSNMKKNPINAFYMLGTGKGKYCLYCGSLIDVPWMMFWFHMYSTHWSVSLAYIDDIPSCCQ